MMSDDVKVSKGLGFPVVALAGVGAHASQGRILARGRASVLRGGDKGCAGVNDWVWWGQGIWAEPIKYQMIAITSAWCFSAL